MGERIATETRGRLPKRTKTLVIVFCNKKSIFNSVCLLKLAPSPSPLVQNYVILLMDKECICGFIHYSPGQNDFQRSMLKSYSLQYIGPKDSWFSPVKSPKFLLLRRLQACKHLSHDNLCGVFCNIFDFLQLNCRLRFQYSQICFNLLTNQDPISHSLFDSSLMTQPIFLQQACEKFENQGQTLNSVT